MIVPILVPSARIERLEARVTPEVKQLIQEAVDLEGRTMSEFLINSAQAAAKKVIDDHRSMKLSVRDREVFVSALLNPPEPSEKLIEAAERYKAKTRA
jgi:uncharacterized protein (DUF1778 family)